MARQARGKSMDPAKVQVFHTVQRCVRRAFLCGEDTVSGKSYDHRKQWIRERLEFLASIFAIDLLTYTVLSNHLHLGESTWGHPQTGSHLAQFNFVVVPNVTPLKAKQLKRIQLPAQIQRPIRFADVDATGSRYSPKHRSIHRI